MFGAEEVDVTSMYFASVVCGVILLLAVAYVTR